MTNRERTRNETDDNLSRMRYEMALKQIWANPKDDNAMYWLTWYFAREPTLEEYTQAMLDLDDMQEKVRIRPTMRAIIAEWNADPIMREVLKELLGDKTALPTESEPRAGFGW